MKKNIIILLLIISFALSFNFLVFSPVEEACAQSRLLQSQEGFGDRNPVGEAFGGGQPEDPRLIVANIIKIFLGFMGLIMVVIFIAAGFRWMTSGGNQDVVSKSKSQISSAIIGLIIILASYALTEFIISCVYGATDSSWMCG